MTNNEKNAVEFITYLKKLCSNEDRLQNFEDYISCHFDIWMKKYAHDPEGIISEIKMFSETGE